IYTVGGHEAVRPAVSVNFRQDHAQTLAVVLIRALATQPGLLADIGKGAVAVVAIEPVWQGREVAGRTDVARLVIEADAGRVVREGPVDVVTDVEVRIAVAVQVAPGGAGAPRIVVETGLAGDVDKAPPALLARHIMA